MVICFIKMGRIQFPFFVFIFLTLMLASACNNREKWEMELLMDTIDTYETAWANEDFLTVEAFFAPDAKRLHTEPYVWDREEIERYFTERAAQKSETPTLESAGDWKAKRDYIEIRIEGNLAYDIFTTEAFKALHIWEKQHDGSWKIKYDVGFLHGPSVTETVIGKVSSKQPSD